METLSHKQHQLELWWWGMPSVGRWFVGSLSIATLAGFLGGVLA